MSVTPLRELPASTHRRGSWGGGSGSVYVAFAMLHWKEVMYTYHQSVFSQQNQNKKKHTLFTTRVWPVDPEPRADALAVRARGHPVRDLEARMQIPHARLVHAEYDEVFRLDLRDVRLVRDAQAAAGGIADVVGVKSHRGLAGTRPVWVGRVLLVATGTRRPIGSCVFVTGYLEGMVASDRQLLNVLWVGWVGEMTVLPTH